jgi:hypothetical protein
VCIKERLSTSALLPRAPPKNEKEKQQKIHNDWQERMERKKGKNKG